MYDIRGKLVHNFLVIDFTTQGNVIECLFWGNGVVAMTADMQIFVAEVQACYRELCPSSATISVDSLKPHPLRCLSNLLCTINCRGSLTWTPQLHLENTNYEQD
jgi:hypothetical protein